MNETKKNRLIDLIEKIDQIDKMIALHANNPSKFMLEQYMTKKEKLFGFLVDEFVDAKIRSPYSFRLIMLALKKYYPDITSINNTNLSKEKHYNELMDFESALI